MSTIDRRIRGQLVSKSPSNNAGTIKTSKGGILHIWTKYFVVIGDLPEDDDAEEEVLVIRPDVVKLLDVPPNQWVGTYVASMVNRKIKGLFTHLLTCSLTHWFIYLLTYSLTGLHTQLLTHLRTHSLTYSLTHALTHSRTYSLTQSRTHLLTHSRTHSLGTILSASESLRSFKFRTLANKVMVGDSDWFIVISEEELRSGDGISSWTEFNRNQANVDTSKMKRVVVEEDKSYKSYPDWVLTHSLTYSLTFLLTHLLTHSPTYLGAHYSNWTRWA